jgi:putative restriction endonuclease
MANAVFTASENSAYDDLIEERYHFPKTYLNQVEAALGDWIIYYEPRRNKGQSSSGGRQAYFAIARVLAVAKDPQQPDHYYARMHDFLEFDLSVPFRKGLNYWESLLEKEDGSTNKGAFGRSVRHIPSEEFNRIVHAGLSVPLDPWEQSDQVAEEVPEYVTRPVKEQISLRKFRDAAFRRHVRNAYSNTCAVTGLRLINGGGRPEVQAAHIRSVEKDGPDTVRNGIALTGTIHWLFDRGLIAFEDDYTILLSSHGISESLKTLIRPERRLLLPRNHNLRPHSTYLKWHRENRFKF